MSEMKQFNHEKFAALKFGEDRLDGFFYDVFNTQKIMDYSQISSNIVSW